MLAGPIFTREALTAPRTLRHFLVRTGYVAALFVLLYTAGQTTFGWQQVRTIGDYARFGGLVFRLFSLVQLTLVLFFSLLFAAGSVAQEKDRRTLILLLMTDLRDRELVLGKLLASWLTIGVLVAASVPVFTLVYMLGGVSLDQIAWSLAVCVATALAGASWSTLVAFWREKTFQTLAISVLGTVVFLAVVEGVVAVAGAETPLGEWAGILNPYRSLGEVMNPLRGAASGAPVRVSALGSTVAMLGLAVVLNGVTLGRLRVWNPSRSVYVKPSEEQTEEARERKAAPRNVWASPVLWREIRTRAYGRKIVAIKAAYLAMTAAIVWWLSQLGLDATVLGRVPLAGLAFVSLSVLSLMLVNAQAVTALTSERDGNTLELLLVTEVTAKEFVFGKLGGILYNTKELLAVPVGLAVWFLAAGWDQPESAFGLLEAVLTILLFGILAVFVAMLGLHSGFSFDSSRSAIGNSLGTVFFLFIGILIFMMLLVEASGSYLIQFQAFVLFIVVGAIGLYASLTHKNPSPALGLAASLLPFLMFYAITTLLLDNAIMAFLAVATAYVFTTVAMLVPAVSDFDVALGRTTVDQG